jgi:hypothetical protein
MSKSTKRLVIDDLDAVYHYLDKWHPSAIKSAEPRIVDRAAVMYLLGDGIRIPGCRIEHGWAL